MEPQREEADVGHEETDQSVEEPREAGNPYSPKHIQLLVTQRYWAHAIYTFPNPL